MAVVDVSAAGWGSASVTLPDFVAALTVFVRAHLLLHWGNRVAVLAFDGVSRCV